ncbi:NDR1/HIN1-like protein 1 [Curcuma longa]|uniref:NDR1/HIN1-like protein 1 n=1 Tax=Curcuma longa TaxID=136217 RepID=UPI003D9E7981
MSSSKDSCGDHGRRCERRRWWRRCIGYTLLFLFLVLLAIFITWLVLRPTKPRFYLRHATVNQFNYSGPPSNLLSTVFQVTVSSRNPNDRIGVHYDRLEAYASYRYQQITLRARLTPLYQGHNDVVLWSPVLFGPAIPIAPYLCDAIKGDVASGFLQLSVRLEGRIRWSVGSWDSGRYRLFVDCPAFLTFQNGVSTAEGAIVQFQQPSRCSVEV